MSVLSSKHRFTVDQYCRMAETGILSAQDKVELIDGEVLPMTPMGSRHAGCVNRLTRLFTQALGVRAVVQVQCPVRLSEYDMPEPDVAILEAREDFYAAGAAGPSDCLLVVEVAESSLVFDRERKLPRYGKAGVLEVWLADLTTRTLHVFRSPQADGYADARELRFQGSVSPLALDDLTVTVAQVFGE